MPQYLLKETDLSVWSEANLDDIADELNDRPCKTLDKDMAPTTPIFRVVGAKRFIGRVPRRRRRVARLLGWRVLVCLSVAIVRAWPGHRG